MSSSRGSAVSEGCCPGSWVAIVNESMQVSSAVPRRGISRRRLQFDSELGESFRRRPSGSAGERVGAAGRLREGDDLADVGFAGEERDEAFDPQRKAAV